MVYRGAKSNHQSGPIYSNEVGQFRLAKSFAELVVGQVVGKISHNEISLPADLNRRKAVAVPFGFQVHVKPALVNGAVYLIIGKQQTEFSSALL